MINNTGFCYISSIALPGNRWLHRRSLYRPSALNAQSSHVPPIIERCCWMPAGPFRVDIASNGNREPVIQQAFLEILHSDQYGFAAHACECNHPMIQCTKLISALLSVPSANHFSWSAINALTLCPPVVELPPVEEQRDYQEQTSSAIKKWEPAYSLSPVCWRRVYQLRARTAQLTILPTP